LAWGIYRLVKIVGSIRKSMMVNKTMILMHITAYLFIIVITFFVDVYNEKAEKAFEVA
jgi:hypothetical protein